MANEFTCNKICYYHRKGKLPKKSGIYFNDCNVFFVVEESPGIFTYGNFEIFRDVQRTGNVEHSKLYFPPMPVDKLKIEVETNNDSFRLTEESPEGWYVSSTHENDSIFLLRIFSGSDSKKRFFALSSSKNYCEFYDISEVKNLTRSYKDVSKMNVSAY